MSEKALVFSLLDPISFLKQGFLNYVSKLINNNDCRVSGYGHALDYNYAPYMNQLLRDIFDDSTLVFDGQRFVLSTTPSCTRILVRDGLDARYASELSKIVFQQVVDIIVHWVPDVNFNEDGYRFTLVDEYDLAVSTPYLNNRDND